MTILIVAASGPGGLNAEAVADHVACGALGAAPDAVALRAGKGDTPPELSRVDLVLAAGVSALTSAVVARATELGVAAVVLGGSLRGVDSAACHPSGLVAYEPDPHPDALDAGLVASGLRRGALSAVLMAAGCLAV